VKRPIFFLGLVLVLGLALLALAAPAVQLAAPNEAGVTMGQFHYVVRDVEANQKFWVLLGATPIRMSRAEAVVKFPDLFIFLTQGPSTGNTEGSVLDHVGFQVANLQETKERMQAAGYKTAPATFGSKAVGNVYTPEGERIELLEDQSENAQITFDDGKVVNGRAGGPKMDVPILLHHVHFNVPESEIPRIKAWYIKNFGAVPCRRWHYEGVNLPGLNINISGVSKKLAPTKGRMLDHFGFEVKNLKAFCKNLQANGVKLDQPYTKQPSGLTTAYLTDPWGNYLELTAGLSTRY
jgi:predicted enzyme related to lactoylglutathione lyase